MLKKLLCVFVILALCVPVLSRGEEEFRWTWGPLEKLVLTEERYFEIRNRIDCAEDLRVRRYIKAFTPNFFYRSLEDMLRFSMDDGPFAITPILVCRNILMELAEEGTLTEEDRAWTVSLVVALEECLATGNDADLTALLEGAAGNPAHTQILDRKYYMSKSTRQDMLRSMQLALEMIGYSDEEYRADTRFSDFSRPLFSIRPDGTAALLYYPRGDSEYTVPAEYEGHPVKAVGIGAFSECAGLKSVVIPESVTAIGHSAFSKCADLESIVIPSGVTKIAPFTFSGCVRLKNVEIPASVTEISDYAFSGLYSYDSDESRIRVYAGSYAEQFCTENGIPYELTE